MNDKQKITISWILFWTFWLLFVLTGFGVLAMLFLDFGSVLESERKLLINGFLVQTAVAIIALFYSLYNLKQPKDHHVETPGIKQILKDADSLIEDIKIEQETKTLPTKTNALYVIEWIINSKNIPGVKGWFALTDSTSEQRRIAANLYTELEGEIIGTEFFECPFYGKGDFAKGIKKGSSFTRITTTDVCDKESAKKVKEEFDTFECHAKLVLVGNNDISKIGGIYCYFNDYSYLAFIALNNYSLKHDNKGLLITGTVAEELFKYYKSFI